MRLSDKQSKGIVTAMILVVWAALWFMVGRAIL